MLQSISQTLAYYLGLFFKASPRALPFTWKLDYIHMQRKTNFQMKRSVSTRFPFEKHAKGNWEIAYFWSVLRPGFSKVYSPYYLFASRKWFNDHRERMRTTLGKPYQRTKQKTAVFGHRINLGEIKLCFYGFRYKRLFLWIKTCRANFWVKKLCNSNSQEPMSRSLQLPY